MIKVATIDWLGGHWLRMRFSDDTEGEFDFSAMVAEQGPMIEPLRDAAYFGRVFLENGAPTWPNGFDMAPAWLYEEMRAAGALSRTAPA